MWIICCIWPPQQLSGLLQVAVTKYAHTVVCGIGHYFFIISDIILKITQFLFSLVCVRLCVMSNLFHIVVSESHTRDFLCGVAGQVFWWFKCDFNLNILNLSQYIYIDKWVLK